MAFLYFVAALGGIVVLALVVNLLTGTKASYLETLVLAAGEKELWRDEAADFATLPALGQAAIRSYPRLRRRTALWTNQRVVVAQKVLFSQKRMITQQLVLETCAKPDARTAAGQFSGGFYGRGFVTLVCASQELSQVNGKDCVCFRPTAASAAALNLVEAYLFSDRLAELQARVPGLGPAGA